MVLGFFFTRVGRLSLRLCVVYVLGLGVSIVRIVDGKCAILELLSWVYCCIAWWNPSHSLNRFDRLNRHQRSNRSSLLTTSVESNSFPTLKLSKQTNKPPSQIYSTETCGTPDTFKSKRQSDSRFSKVLMEMNIGVSCLDSILAWSLDNEHGSLNMSTEVMHRIGNVFRKLVRISLSKIYRVRIRCSELDEKRNLLTRFRQLAWE